MLKIITATVICCLPFFALTAKSSNSLSQTLNVYVFPADGQDSSQQSIDEVECYQWAENNTSVDPFGLVDKEQSNQQVADAEMAAAQQQGAGAGAQGVVKGAAVGAIIGEVADDDAGKGAAIGAVLGGVRGRRKGHQAQAQAQQQATAKQEQRVELSAADLDSFNKAFSVCLEAKDYMVKF